MRPRVFQSIFNFIFVSFRFAIKTFREVSLCLRLLDADRGQLLPGNERELVRADDETGDESVVVLGDEAPDEGQLVLLGLCGVLGVQVNQANQ